MIRYDRAQVGASDSTQNSTAFFGAILATLGLACYGTTFTEDFSGGIGVMLLLFGGLFAVLQLLPNMAETTPYASLLSVVGFLVVIRDVIGIYPMSMSVMVLLSAASLQVLTAIMALVFERGVSTRLVKVWSRRGPRTQPVHRLAWESWAGRASPRQYKPSSPHIRDPLTRHMHPPHWLNESMPREVRKDEDESRET